MLSASCSGGSGAGSPFPIDRIEWRWIENEANLFVSFQKSAPSGYESQIVRTDGKNGLPGKFLLRFLKNGELAAEFESKPSSVFVSAGDVVYFAEFSALRTGCTIIATDLKSRTLLWKCRLRGIGPTTHSAYYNLVLVQLQDDLLIVYGNEANGRYIEAVDVKSGKTIANRVIN
jgi:hypothetical protein